MSGFRVVAPGVLSLFQDAGRFGHHALGLTTGGPMDGGAFYWANRLVGNAEGATVLELAQGGLQLECTGSTTMAVTGAGVPLQINGQTRALWRGHRVEAGDVIELGHAGSGVWAYLAAAGGFEAETFFGSASVVTREGMGRPIQAGQELTCGAPADDEWAVPRGSIPRVSASPVLRVVEGFQSAEFSKAALDDFFGGTFKVSPQSDRMGCRLEGPGISPPTAERLSEGTTYGAVQVPPSGQSIVLLNDRQTIGGYAKLGVVLSVDCWKLAQCRPGVEVSFERITLEAAQECVRNERLARERLELRRCEQ